MFALSRKTGYALIALSVLAKRAPQVVSAREIAADSGVSLPVLTNILKSLVHAEIVVSERGACGGYRLAKSPDTVTLHDLIAAIEGPFRFVRCARTKADLSNRPCDLESSCPTRVPAHRIHARLKQFLSSITIAELVDDTATPVERRMRKTEPQDLEQTVVKELAT